MLSKVLKILYLADFHNLFPWLSFKELNPKISLCDSSHSLFSLLYSVIIIPNCLLFRRKLNKKEQKREEVIEVLSSSGDNSMAATGKCSKVRPRFEMLKSMSIQNSIDVSNNQMVRLFFLILIVFFSKKRQPYFQLTF